MSEKDIKSMFEKFKIDNHKINYKDFIYDIRSYVFKPANLYVILLTY